MEEPGRLHAVHGIAKSRTWLGEFTFTFHFGEGNDNTLQCSCLENPRDGGALVGCRLWGRNRVGQDCRNLAVARLTYGKTQQFVPANLWRDLSLKYIFPGLIKWYKYWQPPDSKCSVTCCTIKTKRSWDCHSPPSSSWYFGGCKFWQQSQMLDSKILCME